MATGCIQAQLCHTNTCPVGVATQDPRRMRALDVADKTTRVANYQQATVEQAMQVIASMGLHGPDGLGPDLLRRRVSEWTTASYSDIYPYLEHAELLAGGPQDWQDDWHRADPDSFAPVTSAQPRGARKSTGAD